MKTTFHSIHRHIKKHHKKYLFGLFGGYAIVKLVLLVLGLSAVQYLHISTFAQLESGCVMTGQYYTGEYQTGGYLTGQELTGGYLTGCITLSGYRTGGTLNESGDLVDQARVEESQTGCFLEGQVLTGGYLTGYYLTGGYRTGGTIVCETGTTQTGTEQTGTTQTGTIQQQTVTLGNSVCDSGDIVWSKPVAGNSVRDGIVVEWAYSGTDCVVSGNVLQLRDHNNQWITLSTIASGATSYAFDTRRLYSFQYSGLYHIIGNTGAGNFLLYAGQYTGSYSRFFTGYKVRLLTPAGTGIYETQPFTIDNQYPTLTGASLMTNGSSTGYLVVSGVVTLSFTASEALSGLQVTLGSGKLPTTSAVSGLSYTYTWTLTSLYPEGTLAANISFADIAGNTGALVYTSNLIFDITIPSATGFAFTESTGGITFSFATVEPVIYNLNYRKSGGSFVRGSSAEYLTAHQLLLSGVERDQLYAFTLDVLDRAGHKRSFTGDFMRMTLGQIVSNISAVSAVQEAALSGSLATLAVVLKAEVEKFNACKNALTFTPIELEVRRNSFIIQMPQFKKSQMKTLVNAFTLFLLDKVKGDYKIAKADIDEITKKFDNFLVILKLLRDDDNNCKQNLSNYHISQFQRALEEYNINLE